MPVQYEELNQSRAEKDKGQKSDGQCPSKAIVRDRDRRRRLGEGSRSLGELMGSWPRGRRNRHRTWSEMQQVGFVRWRQAVWGEARKNRTVCDASSPFVPSSIISFSFILLSSRCIIRKQTKKGQSAFEREQWVGCAPPLLTLVGPAACWSCGKAAPCWSASADPVQSACTQVASSSVHPLNSSRPAQLESGGQGWAPVLPGTELCRGLQWRKGKEET